MRRALTILFTLVGVTIVTGPGAAYAAYPGTISVDSAKARPSESVAVSVWLQNNNVPVSAIRLPLKFSSSALTLDSVSMNGTVWGADFIGYSVIDNTARTVRITVLPNEIISPLPTAVFTDGIVAVLHFKVAAGAPLQRVEIDSIYIDSLIGSDIHLFTRIDMSDNTGTGVYLPGFSAGNVEITSPTGVNDGDGTSTLPTDFALEQNYPNPFNPSTVIAYSLPKAGSVKLEVFNILGQQVATLFEGHRDAGTYTAQFDGAKQPSGIYFYRLRHDGGVETRKMMLLK